MGRTIWFRRKRYGWGWTPATWQGWVTILVYVISIFLVVLNSRTETVDSGQIPVHFTLRIVSLTAILIAICYAKGEPPHWQWGDDPSDDIK